MKTNEMSLIKTNELTSLVLSITLIFILSLILILLFFFSLHGLPTEEKITAVTKVMAIIAIFAWAMAITINAYNTSRLSLGIDQSTLGQILSKVMAWEKKVEMGINYTQSNVQELDTERFYQAIKHLGNDKIETRFAAIYELERIARDFPKNHWTIMEILAAFIRENAPARRDSENNLPEKLPTDIQTALTVIGRRNAQYDLANKKLDLRDIDISNADLMEANLSGVILIGANLQWVNFIGANLSGANLTEANLCGAVLYEANLHKAILPEANLQEAVLRKVDLAKAILYEADLQGAMLYDANLQDAVLYNANLEDAILCDTNLAGANLEGCNLSGANLIGSNLQGAKLIGANLEAVLLSTANLQEANLYEANLEEANFYEANLKYATLTGANLNQAIFQKAKMFGCDLTKCENLESQQLELALGDRTTILPENLEIPAHWCQNLVDCSVSDSET
ncbi:MULTISPECIES: pentapeptide repeat-containing protein [unclassified Tolypothrix]|nr:MULTISPECIES: pentapeptide repeat-containing protein [unclassified Tolypothrix]EKF00927.1 putative pentapeptide repeat-containing domain protein [Tolypothrix sp. PCC 7601]BAY94884.1 pentapeptide repeat-containing protein [Microchaete diplosiphon NIES-3275]